MNSDNAALISLLNYYQEIGASDLINPYPTNWLHQKTPTSPAPISAAMQITTNTPATKNSTPLSSSARILAKKASSQNPLPYIDALKKKLAPIDQIDALKEFLETFEDCAIKRTAMHLVMSKGNPKASIMVVTDMPSEEEDRTGEAYKGPAGELYRKMMRAINLNIEHDIYSCHFLPWRTPGNRTPSAKEAAIFSLILQKHIALIAPKHLFFMGSIASKAIFKPKSVTGLAGKEKAYPCPFREQINQTAFITYSPAFLLNSPTYKKQAWGHLQKFRELIT